MMAQDDRAIVVGIRCYLDRGDLDGSENDAKAFYAWLIDSKGGNVPCHHVRLIVTSQWETPFLSVEKAHPTIALINEAIEELQSIGRQNNGHVGRRLYLYMAGHGFAPSLDQTGLLGANATRERVGPLYHILGEYTADWFYQAGYFNEIILFMDCCRERYSVPALNMSYRDIFAHDAVERVKRKAFLCICN
jgi:hypothetical protein